MLAAGSPVGLAITTIVWHVDLKAGPTKPAESADLAESMSPASR